MCICVIELFCDSDSTVIVLATCIFTDAGAGWQNWCPRRISIMQPLASSKQWILFTETTWKWCGGEYELLNVLQYWRIPQPLMWYLLLHISTLRYFGIPWLQYDFSHGTLSEQDCESMFIRRRVPRYVLWLYSSSTAPCELTDHAFWCI